MNIINFIDRLPDEASCIDLIKELRILQGVICQTIGIARIKMPQKSV